MFNYSNTTMITAVQGVSSLTIRI